MSTDTVPDQDAAPRAPRLQRRLSLAVTLLAAAATAGCDTVHGPSLDVIAPRVRGRAVDGTTGDPVAGVRAGRRLSGWRQPTGGYRRGAEEFLLLQDEVRTGKDGRFELPPKRVALLFSLRDPGLQMGLELRHGRHLPWQTNFPVRALSEDPSEPRIDAGDIPLTPKPRH